MTTAPVLRQHLLAILRDAVTAVDAGGLLTRALDRNVRQLASRAAAVDVLAVGKAAAPMLSAAGASDLVFRTILGIGPPRSSGSHLVLPAAAEWHEGGHPHPNRGSVLAATRAIELARSVDVNDLLLVLLSGGGSALMCLPAAGLSLEAKQRTASTLMAQGADIYELNTVRKHLSAIKGGRLAAAARGRVLTLAVSDVVGDDLSVIASGPTVPDPSTYEDALQVLARRGGFADYPAAAVEHLRQGAAGAISETPKADDGQLRRAEAVVIGHQRGAIDGARQAAERLGYHVHVVADPVTGEARVAAQKHVASLAPLVATLPKPVCVISSGETTVTVTGGGMGGRNQEFALAMAGPIESQGWRAAAASIGTDGIDGPTDAAGALVDASTLERARSLVMEPEVYLQDNNAYVFFERLGDLIRTGPTGTNVGDLQVVLVD